MDRCSFCGKKEDEVKILVEGREIKTNKPRLGVSATFKAKICNECVNRCNTVIADQIAKGIQVPQG